MVSPALMLGDIMKKFKPNQKLLCIDATNQKVLEHGRVYTVSDDPTHLRENQEGGRVYIKEWRRFSFNVSRFEVIYEMDSD